MGSIDESAWPRKGLRLTSLCARSSSSSPFRWTTRRLIAALCVGAGVSACTLSLDYLESGGPSTDAGFDASMLDGHVDGRANSEGGDGPIADRRASESGGDALSGPDGGDGSSATDSGCSNAPGTGTGNFLQNQGFESDAGVSPWTPFAGSPSSLTQVTTPKAHGGQYSCRTSNRIHTYDGPSQDITALVGPGQTYTGSAWAMIGSPDAGADGGISAAEPIDLTAKILCNGNATATYLQIGAVTATATTWTQISGTFSTPSCTTCPISLVEVYVEGPAAGIDLYVDDVSIMP
jgi:hypothetical protein